MEEIWKVVEEFPTYEVSNLGRIKFTKSNTIKTTKIKNGRVIIRFKINNKQYERFLSRILAIAFIPNPENKSDVNHIDENPLNNDLSNLEWTTRKENNNHGTRNKRASLKMLKNGGKRVKQIDLQGNLIKIYPSCNRTQQHGFTFSLVAKVCRGEQNTHKGFKWEYV